MEFHLVAYQLHSCKSVFSPLSSADLLLSVAPFKLPPTHGPYPGGTHPMDRHTHTLTAVRLLWSFRKCSKDLVLAFVKICHACKDPLLSFNLPLSPRHRVAPTISQVLIGCCGEVWWPINTVKDNFTLCALITIQ